MTVGERIKRAREMRAITQTELANACRISKQSLYKYENNIITNIPADKIELIAHYLSISPAHLMGWSDLLNESKDKSVTQTINNENTTINGNQSNVINDKEQYDEMTEELIKKFQLLSFDKKIEVFNYIKNL